MVIIFAAGFSAWRHFHTKHPLHLMYKVPLTAVIKHADLIGNGMKWNEMALKSFKFHGNFAFL